VVHRGRKPSLPCSVTQHQTFRESCYFIRELIRSGNEGREETKQKINVKRKGTKWNRNKGENKRGGDEVSVPDKEQTQVNCYVLSGQGQVVEVGYFAPQYRLPHLRKNRTAGSRDFCLSVCSHSTKFQELCRGLLWMRNATLERVSLITEGLHINCQ
jgi:hypothetical protein